MTTKNHRPDDPGECPVCFSEDAVLEFRPRENDNNWKCPRCGIFHCSLSMQSILSNTTDAEYFGCHNSRKRANVSAWIHRNQDHRIFGQDDIPFLLSLTPPSIIKRMDDLLLFFARHTDAYGTITKVPMPQVISTTWSSERKEALRLCGALAQRKLTLENTGTTTSTYNLSITLDGWAKIDELQAKTIDSKQGFVAMWFDEDMDNIYDNGIHPGIGKAGYRPFRVDRTEHVNKIDDEVIAGIRRSKFVVADFTGHRGGVYYEAGFAHGLGIPVIFACRKDDMENLHFDIRQYCCIDWKDENDLRERVQKRIEAVVGVGPVVPKYEPVAKSV